MIREPAVAGSFYSAAPQALHKMLDSFLSASSARVEAKGIVCPHAGYMYSGAVAGSVYGAVRLPKRVVILGPNHTGRGVPFSVYPEGEWRTPLGLVPIDADLNSRLLAACPLLREDRAAHLGEHSIEVQIPFLQVQVRDLSITAICVGSHDLKSLLVLGQALALAVQESPDGVLLVASSDMTHFEPAEEAARKDHMAIQKVLEVDPEGLHRVVLGEDISMCGFAPTVAVLAACREMGATAGTLMHYANSGDVSRDYREVVGYAGMVIA
jgi:AmmeMemoRadiSam system protein B